MRSHETSGSYVSDCDAIISLNNGEKIVNDEGTVYEDEYEVLVEIGYKVSGLHSIPYGMRTSLEDYEEEVEVTKVILLEGFTWNGEHYEEGTDVCDYPELDELFDYEKIENDIMEIVCDED